MPVEGDEIAGSHAWRKPHLKGLSLGKQCVSLDSRERFFDRNLERCRLIRFRAAMRADGGMLMPFGLQAHQQAIGVNDPPRLIEISAPIGVDGVYRETERRTPRSKGSVGRQPQDRARLSFRLS